MSFAVGWSYANVSAVAPELAQDYGVSVPSIGFLTMIVLAVFTVTQLPAGRALDRLGPTRVGAAGLVVIGLSNGIALIDNSFWIALAARALLGVGTPLAYLGGLELIRRLGGSSQLLAGFGAVNGASMGLALLVVPQLDGLLAWRGPYLSSEVLVALALLAMLPRPGRAARRRAPAPAPAADLAPAAGALPGAPVAYLRVPLAELLRDRQLLRLAVMNFSSAAFSPIISSWVVALLVEAGGYSNRTAGAIGSISLLGLVASRPVAGWLVHHRPGRVRAGVVVSAAMGVGGCLALAVAGPLWLAIAGCLLVGVATGVPWTHVFSRAPTLRPGAAGSSLAVVSGVPLLFAIAGIPLVGLTFALPGDGRIGFVVIAVLWAALLFVLPAQPAQPERTQGVAG